MRYHTAHGFFELNPFPGCNQIVVSNHAFIQKEYRGKGFGDLDHKTRLSQARILGYNYIICTVKSDNTPQIRILEKNEWKLLDEFLNKETENKILIYGKKL